MLRLKVLFEHKGSEVASVDCDAVSLLVFGRPVPVSLGYHKCGELLNDLLVDINPLD